MWICPDCGREFKTKNQWHSCAQSSIQEHFSNKPGLYELFEILISRIQHLRPFDIDPVKTSIQFRAESTFLQVTIRKDHLRLQFQLPECIEEFPMARAQQISSQRWLHLIMIDSKEEIDETLVEWLGTARRLASAE